MSNRVIVWFRNDLRVTDNPTLTRALALLPTSKTNTQPANLLCVYCFDPRHFSISPFGSKKTAHFRAQFLLESISNLRKNLRSLGQDLLVALGEPERVIPALVRGEDESAEVVVQGEVTWDELQVERKVERALSAKRCALHRVRGSELFHIEDLPFRSDLKDVPDVFTAFKEKVEKHCSVRPLLPTVRLPRTNEAKERTAAYLESEHCGFDFLPSMRQLGFTEQEIASASTALDPSGVMRFEGGEDAGQRRAQEWMFRDDRLKDYFDIRNGMLGEAYSSKLSPWLSLGCLSPRWIYYEAKRYEAQRVSNKSTYWLIFELLWRDFFRSLCAKHGNKIFFEGGAAGARVHWRVNAELLRRWKLGLTGRPLVDANMRELLATGWMSNRGRQNVASYLVLDLGIDWRIGADHFESLLLDHDVCSNYGNWNAAAGLASGRVNKFNVTKQSRDYDPSGEYIKHWLPELRNVPAPLVFEPWRLSEAEQERYGVRVGVDYPTPHGESSRGAASRALSTGDSGLFFTNDPSRMDSKRRRETNRRPFGRAPHLKKM